MSEITVLLVDDHSLVRKGFRKILEDDPTILVVGEAGDGLAAIEQARSLRPRVIVMDYAMPGMNGVQATAQILEEFPDTAILILSMYSEDNYIRNAFAAGVKGYLLKDAMDVDLAEAVHDLAAGKQVLARSLAAAMKQPTDPKERLTTRETQILQLIASGKSNKEIAAMLSLSVNTVAVHRANLMEELGIHNTAELVVYAIRKGLIVP